MRIDAAANLAAAESYLERFEEGVAHGERGLAVARATGQGELLPILIPTLNAIMVALGRVVDGAELMDGAVEGARLAGNVQALAWNLLNRALMAMLAGDLELALSAPRKAGS